MKCPSHFPWKPLMEPMYTWVDHVGKILPAKWPMRPSNPTRNHRMLQDSICFSHVSDGWDGLPVKWCSGQHGWFWERPLRKGPGIHPKPAINAINRLLSSQSSPGRCLGEGRIRWSNASDLKILLASYPTCCCFYIQIVHALHIPINHLALFKNRAPHS